MSDGGSKLGTLFIEIDAERTKYDAKAEKIYEDAEKTVKTIEGAWRKLGSASDESFAKQRATAKLAYEKIRDEGTRTPEEIARAYALAEEKIANITAKQYASQIAEGNKLVEARARESAEKVALETKTAAGIRASQENQAQQMMRYMAAEREAYAMNATFKAELRAQENRANAEYWMAKNAFEKQAMAQSQKQQADYWMTLRAHEKKEMAESQRQQAEYWMARMKYEKDQQALAASGKVSTAVPAQYAALGIRPQAIIQEQMALVSANAAAVQALTTKGSQDWINAERAKNEQLKKLNAEMVGDHEMSMAAMMRGVLRFYAVWYVAQMAIQTVGGFLMSGVKAIDDMKVSSISIAAQITTMQGSTGNVTENYKKNLAYAKALVPVLMQVDANSIANLEQIQKMNNAMVMQGVILNVNSKTQIESFTALTNAVAMYTQGQDKEKQATQEIRALMSGKVKAGNELAMQMDAAIRQQGVYKGGLEELLKVGKQHNNTLELMKPYLIGIVAAAGDLNATWQAVSSSIETAWKLIQMSLFKDIYKDLTKSGKEAAEWMKKNSDDIVKSIKSTYETLKYSLEAAAIAVGLFTLYTVASITTTGDIMAWFALRVEYMRTSIDASTSKMKIAWATFAAFIIGFEFGKWAYNQSEIVRQAAVNMVYSLNVAYDWLAKTFKVAGEWLTRPIDVGQPEGTEARALINASNKRIEIYEKEYDAKKKFSDDYLRDESKNITDAGIAEAKRLADAKKKGVDIPEIPKPKPEGSKPSESATKSIIEAERKENKAKYEEEMAYINEVSKLAQRRGQEALTTIEVEWINKSNALDEFTNKEEELARREVDSAARAAARAKKEYDAKGVLAEKLAAIHAVHNKTAQQIETDRAVHAEDTKIQAVSTMAEINKMTDKYSSASLDSQVKLLEEKKKKDMVYATDKLAVDRAYQIESDKLLITHLAGRNQIELSYAESTVGPWAEATIALKENAIQLQADLAALDAEFMGEAFDREVYVTSLMASEDDKRLSDKASYYASIKGMEDEALKSGLEAIEARRKAEQKLDPVAADKKASQAMNKLEADAATQKISYIKDAMGAQADAFEQMSQLYAEDSDERKKLHNISMAFATAEKAANLAAAVVKAVEACANAAANGDPYTAVARIAAVAAALAAVFASAGLSFGGGDAAASASTYVAPTTVLGSTEQSQSIANSMKILDDTYSMEYRELTKLNDSMKDLNNNITGLVTSIVRTGGTGFRTGEIASMATEGNALGSTWNLQNKYLMPSGGSIVSAESFILGKTNDFIGKQLDKIFGGSSTSTLTATGYNIGPGTPEYLLGGGQSSAMTWAKVHTHTEGGWFSSDDETNQMIYGAASNQVKDMLTLVFKNMSQVIVELAKGLGTDMNTAMSYVFQGAAVDFTGLTTEQISTKMNEVFSTIGDVAVEALFGSVLKGYQQLNEGLMETAIRIMTDKEVILESLRMTNQSFTGTAAEAIKFSESIITMAGSLEKFTDAVATYYDKFFTDEEKQTRLKAQLYSVLGAAGGWGLPDTRAGYRAMVESLDLTTAYGQKSYEVMISLSSAADEYYTAVENATGGTKDLTSALKDQFKTINEWLINTAMSPTTAPAVSMESYVQEYQRQRMLASASGASSDVVSGYLSYATKFLEYMRSYGGDYKEIYKMVTGDVTKLRDTIQAQLPTEQLQLEATKEADKAARDAAERMILAIQGKAVYAGGGLTRGASIAGESGPEWVVPTYEPSRSNFLRGAPQSFWENLNSANSANGGSNGGEEIVIHNHLYVDGKEISDTVARYIPRNSNLTNAIRKVQ